MLDLSRQKVLIVAPHPDDEVIGCSGLIQKVKAAGGKVFVIFLTVGDTQDFSPNGLSTAEERIREIQNVARKLKFDKYDIIFNGNNYHLRLDTLGQKAVMDLVERRSALSIEKIKPTVIAFPSLVSYNQDHQIAARAVHAALRPAHKKKHYVNLVLTYENPAERWRLQEDHEANFYVRMTQKQLDTKLDAMKLYTSQVRPAPNPRALSLLKAWAKVRGGQCGSPYAEGFVSYRMAM